MKNKTTLLLLGSVALVVAAIFLAWPDPPKPKPQIASVPATTTPPPLEIRTQKEIEKHVGFDPPPPPTPGEIDEADAMTIPVTDPLTGELLVPALPLQAGELPWETTLNGIINTPGISDAEIGKRLLEAIPNLPVQGRETAAAEAIRRIPSAQYELVLPTITNSNTYGLALTELFADLMQRPQGVRLPTLLKIARTPQHPLAANARENLDALLGQDFGTDWNRWDAAIKADLTQHQ